MNMVRNSVQIFIPLADVLCSWSLAAGVNILIVEDRRFLHIAEKGRSPGPDTDRSRHEWADGCARRPSANQIW